MSQESVHVDQSVHDMGVHTAVCKSTLAERCSMRVLPFVSSGHGADTAR
jgi:hypothetical protein